MNSQFDWFEENVKPKLEGLSREEAIYKISSLSSNRTAMNRNVQFYLEEANIRKAVALGHQAMGSSSLYDTEMKTFQGAVNNLMAKWNDFLINFGTNILPAFTSAVSWAARVLGGINKQNEKDKDQNLFTLGATFAKPGIWWERKMGFLPPERAGSTVPITVNMNVDGRLMAQKTVEHFLDGSGHDSGGNDVDYRSTLVGPGFASATGQ